MTLRGLAGCTLTLGSPGNPFASCDQVCVKDFGAKGDGFTDDTTAIQAAIDSASVNNGGEIFFPSGTYLHAGLTPKSDVGMFGVGMYGSILECTVTNRPAISSASAVYNWRMRDMGFKATNNTNYPCIQMTNGSVRAYFSRLAISKYLVGIDIYGAIHSHLDYLTMSGLGAAVANGIGIKLGNRLTAVAATTTLITQPYISGYYTGFKNDYCANCTLIQPIVEYFTVGFDNLYDSLFIDSYLEAGVPGAIGFQSIGPMDLIGGTNSTISTLYNLISGGDNLGQERFSRLQMGQFTLGSGISSSRGQTNPVRFYPLHGSKQISDANTTGAVTFVINPGYETVPDDDYFVTAIVGATSAAPHAGSTRVFITNKTTAGFTINLEVAPGVGDSVTVDWMVMR